MWMPIPAAIIYKSPFLPDVWQDYPAKVYGFWDMIKESVYGKNYSFTGGSQTV